MFSCFERYFSVDQVVKDLDNAIIFGIAMKSCASGTTKTCLNDISEAITKVVTWVIHCAPFGIMGLVADSVGTAGIGALLGYVQLLAVLVASYFLVALVMNPAIVFSRIHDGSDRVIDDRKDQVVKDLDNAAWRSQLCFRSHLQNQRSREKEGHPDTNKRSTECADCVKNDDRLHAAFCIFLALCHGVHDKEENENRRNAFQCFDEEVAQNGYGRNGSRRKDGDENADDKADGDLLD